MTASPTALSSATTSKTIVRADAVQARRPVPAPPVIPSYEQFAAAVKRECTASGVPVTDRQIRQLDEMLGKAAKHLVGGHQHYYIPQRMLDSVHDVYVAIMPDGALAADGSAHALANRRHCTGTQVSMLVHSSADGYDRRDHCTVTLEVVTAG